MHASRSQPRRVVQPHRQSPWRPQSEQVEIFGRRVSDARGRNAGAGVCGPAVSRLKRDSAGFRRPMNLDRYTCNGGPTARQRPQPHGRDY